MEIFVGTSGPRTLIHLKTTQGTSRCISDFSVFPNENEAVLPPGSTFRIERHADLGNGLIIVTATEAEPVEAIWRYVEPVEAIWG